MEFLDALILLTRQKGGTVIPDYDKKVN